MNVSAKDLLVIVTPDEVQDAYGFDTGVLEDDPEQIVQQLSGKSESATEADLTQFQADDEVPDGDDVDGTADSDMEDEDPSEDDELDDEEDVGDEFQTCKCVCDDEDEDEDDEDSEEEDDQNSDDEESEEEAEGEEEPEESLKLEAGPSDKIIADIEAGKYDKALDTLERKFTANKNTKALSAIKARRPKVGKSEPAPGDGPAHKMAKAIVRAIDKAPEYKDAEDAMNAAGLDFEDYMSNKKAVDKAISALTGSSSAQAYAKQQGMTEEDDVSKMCDMGYHNRCRDKSCTCGCHGKRESSKIGLILAKVKAVPEEAIDDIVTVITDKWGFQSYIENAWDKVLPKLLEGASKFSDLAGIDLNKEYDFSKFSAVSDLSGHDDTFFPEDEEGDAPVLYAGHELVDRKGRLEVKFYLSTNEDGSGGPKETTFVTV